jgi:hypothetical protein
LPPVAVLSSAAFFSKSFASSSCSFKAEHGKSVSDTFLTGTTSGVAHPNKNREAIQIIFLIFCINELP